MSPKLLTILFILTPVVLYTAVLKPMYVGEGVVWTPENTIPALQTVIDEHDSTLANIDTVVRDITKLNSDYEKLDQAVLAQNNYMLGTGIDVARLRAEVVSIASKQGVAIEGLEVAKDRRGAKNADFYNVSFSVKARYPAFKNLIAAYERNMRFYTIDSLSIARQKEEATVTGTNNLDKDALNISVKFRVYQLRAK
ncbi:MAG: hypothetical protein RI935_574 [Candidatus Parcubacteria bacterium]|jgi:hypothetical protein